MGSTFLYRHYHAALILESMTGQLKIEMVLIDSICDHQLQTHHTLQRPHCPSTLQTESHKEPQPEA